MKTELSNILAAILTLTMVIGLSFVLKADWINLLAAFTFSIIIISTSVLSKKIFAYLLDSNVEHEFWTVKRFGFKPSQHFKKPILAGLIFPLLFTLISLGVLKVMTLLTYETRALKHRAAKRFGYYSYTEMTDWHNGLIGAAGIMALLILALIVYLIPGSNLELLSKFAVYYALWNLIPISKLDGSQIFFGSKVLWASLAIITLISTVFALII